ncbi:hypothetical protein HDU96_001448 [Phlyctochytrium bullatum]|nr:hypothetical protein HDU96_001448 [Phlyctochytrium bullatum]
MEVSDSEATQGYDAELMAKFIVSTEEADAIPPVELSAVDGATGSARPSREVQVSAQRLPVPHSPCEVMIRKVKSPQKKSNPGPDKKSTPTGKTSTMHASSRELQGPQPRTPIVISKPLPRIKKEPSLSPLEMAELRWRESHIEWRLNDIALRREELAVKRLAMRCDLVAQLLQAKVELKEIRPFVESFLQE